MRITYITPLPIPSRAANSVHIMKICQALSKMGHQVMLRCPRVEDSDPSSKEGDIFRCYGVQKCFLFSPVCKLVGRPGLILYGIRNAFAAKIFKADLIYSRCLMSAWVCAWSGLPVLFQIHDSLDHHGFVGRFIFKSLSRHKNFVCLSVISHALKKHIMGGFDLPADKIIVAPDGSDPLPEQEGAPPFQKKEGRLDAGYVGHLYRGRGIDLIAEIAKKVPDVSFHIVGGTEEDIRIWKERLISQENIYFHGFVPHHQAVEFVRNFDVLLAPYQREVGLAGGKGNTAQWMSPLKIFEYMSTGKPIICSDLPVLREVLTDKSNAFLCMPDSPDEWVAALLYIKNNPEEAQTIGQTALKQFLASYTWQKKAERVLEGVYANIGNGR